MKFDSIGMKLNIVGGLFTLVLIVLVSVSILMNSSLKKDAYVVNMAGLQRMLTQKMSKEVLYVHFNDSSDFRQLQSAMDLFEYNLDNLTHGNLHKGIDEVKNPQIKQKLQEVKKQWLEFKNHIFKVRNGIKSIKDDILSLKIKTEKLLNNSDKIVSLMVKENLNAKYIDLSGRQRMLSQRMWVFSTKYLKYGQKSSYGYFNDAKELFNETLKNFVEDKKLTKYKNLHEQILLTHKYWKEYIFYINSLIKKETAINISIEYIFQNNTKLLNTMDEAVSLFTNESENKNQTFLNIIYLVALFAILVTIYSYILTREVILHIKSFVSKAKRLSFVDLQSPNEHSTFLEHTEEHELKEASLYIVDYVNKVNKAIVHSNNTIKNVENLADEVQRIVTDMEQIMHNLNIDEQEKSKFNKKANAAEDIAIQSAENLIHVSSMLTKLQKSLEDIKEKTP